MSQFIVVVQIYGKWADCEQYVLPLHAFVSLAHHYDALF